MNFQSFIVLIFKKLYLFSNFELKNKNLLSKLHFKIILLIVIFFFVFDTTRIYAASSDFDVSSNSIYTVTEDGNTTISQQIKIVNKKDFIYTPSYSVTVGLDDLSNIDVFNKAGSIPFEIKKNEDGETITVLFENRIVGVGRENDFTISFDTPGIAKKQGSIWEINIPGLSDPSDFSEYDSTLQVPDSFQSAHVIKPQKYTEKSPTTYSFTKNDISTSGIFLLFGESQYYKLNLLYHISNSNLFPIKTEIALPPSTNYQDVSIQSITPSPSDVYEDPDGNWLAIYSLNPQQQLTITVNGIAKISSQPSSSPLTSAQMNTYIKGQTYWEATNSKIKTLALQLKTPENIYNYVVRTLSYNYNKVSDTNTRLGAAKVIANPTDAVCLEFTDLFVALARAAGIPAREMEGYAYTQNSKLRPLSLVNDVLHAWPEYYDTESQKWIMVDPTWGNTTKGLDYFNSLDFDHISFVINGSSSTYPIPAGGYKFSSNSKDVNVSFASKNDFMQIEKTALTISTPGFELSGFSPTAFVSLKNIGTIPIINKMLTVTSDFLPHSQTYQVTNIPPFGTKSLAINFDKTPLFASSPLTNKTYQITILFDGNSIRKVVSVGLVPDTGILLLGGGIFCAGILILIITIKAWGLLVQRR